MDELSDDEKTLLARARRIQFFLSQNFNVAEQFTGQPGSYIPVAETVRGFKGNFGWEAWPLPEDAFRGVGSIEDVIAKAEKWDSKKRWKMSNERQSLPDGLVYDHHAAFVSVKTIDGEIRVLPRHINTIAVLAVDQVQGPSGRWRKTRDWIAVDGGIIEVVDNVITIVADSAERGSEHW